MISRFKMAAILPIFASRHFDQKKKKKNTFQKEFFSEIWLLIRDYEYIYITEIKMDNLYTCGI